MRDRLVGDGPAAGIIDVQPTRPRCRARTARPRHALPSGDGTKKSDGGLAGRVDDTRIHDDTLGSPVHQGRSEPPGTASAAASGPSARRRLLPAGHQPLVRCPLGLQQPLDTDPQRVSPGESAEVGAGALLLCLRPGDRLLASQEASSSQAEVLGDIDAVVRLSRRSPGSVQPAPGGAQSCNQSTTRGRGNAPTDPLRWPPTQPRSPRSPPASH